MSLILWTHMFEKIFDKFIIKFYLFVQNIIIEFWHVLEECSLAPYFLSVDFCKLTWSQVLTAPFFFYKSI